eukprot:SAG25_NODE_316_length_9962_cov_5.659637_10_plen_93_part_00
MRILSPWPEDLECAGHWLESLRSIRSGLAPSADHDSEVAIGWLLAGAGCWLLLADAACSGRTTSDPGLCGRSLPEFTLLTPTLQGICQWLSG